MLFQTIYQPVLSGVLPIIKNYIEYGNDKKSIKERVLSSVLNKIAEENKITQISINQDCNECGILFSQYKEEQKVENETTEIFLIKILEEVGYWTKTKTEKILGTLKIINIDTIEIALKSKEITKSIFKKCWKELTNDDNNTFESFLKIGLESLYDNEETKALFIDWSEEHKKFFETKKLNLNDVIKNLVTKSDLSIEEIPIAISSLLKLIKSDPKTYIECLEQILKETFWLIKRKDITLSTTTIDIIDELRNYKSKKDEIELNEINENDTIIKNKKKIIFRLSQISSFGIKLTKKFTPEDSLEDLEAELKRIELLQSEFQNSQTKLLADLHQAIKLKYHTINK
jgi:hypothetical protein